MTVLGITGGIGMGKSTAADFLRAAEIPLVDTDDLARRLVAPGSAALDEIVADFGPEVLELGGALDRSKLARVVFADAEARRRLGRILHPRIAAGWKAQVDRWRAAGARLGAVVIPLLFENGHETDFGAVVCVACSAGTQRLRLLERQWSDDEIGSRNAAQIPVAEKMRRSRFVVWTEGDRRAHERQWQAILSRL